MAHCDQAPQDGILNKEFHFMYGSVYFITYNYTEGECQYDLQYTVDIDSDITNNILPVYVGQKRKWVALQQ